MLFSLSVLLYSCWQKSKWPTPVSCRENKKLQSKRFYSWQKCNVRNLAFFSQIKYQSYFPPVCLDCLWIWKSRLFFFIPPKKCPPSSDEDTRNKQPGYPRTQGLIMIPITVHFSLLWLLVFFHFAFSFYISSPVCLLFHSYSSLGTLCFDTTEELTMKQCNM